MIKIMNLTRFRNLKKVLNSLPKEFETVNKSLKNRNWSDCDLIIVKEGAIDDPASLDKPVVVLTDKELRVTTDQVKYIPMEIFCGKYNQTIIRWMLKEKIGGECVVLGEGNKVDKILKEISTLASKSVLEDIEIL